MPTQTQILKEVEKKIETKAVASFDPKEFFKDRKGLWVSSSFIERIRDRAPIVSGERTINVSYFELIQNASDKKIEDSLPEKHIFTESEVCAVIADLITNQSKGEEGVLLNTGYVNLFYTEAFVVRVGWFSRGSGWRVGAWPRDGRGWSADSRVFSPAN